MEKRGRIIAYIRPRVEGMDAEEQLKMHGADLAFTEAPGARTFEAQVQLHKCLDSLQEGDLLQVQSMSCLARNFRDLNNIARRVQGIGAAIHFEMEDTFFNTHPVSDAELLSLPIIQAFDTFNRELIKERKLEAFAKAKAKGQHIGRPPKISKEQRKQIRQRLGQGEKPRPLAREFEVSESTIYDIKKGR